MSVIRGFLQSASAYVSRGRRFASQSIAELDNAWVGALRKLVPDPADPELRVVWNDITAEFQLRRQDPPFDRARGDLDAWIHAVDALMVDKKESDPDDWERMNHEMSSDIDEFIQKSGRAN